MIYAFQLLNVRQVRNRWLSDTLSYCFTHLRILTIWFQKNSCVGDVQQNAIYPDMLQLHNYEDADNCGGRHEARNIYRKGVSIPIGRILFFLECAGEIGKILMSPV